jgi:hypothetical protein
MVTTRNIGHNTHEDGQSSNPKVKIATLNERIAQMRIASVTSRSQFGGVPPQSGASFLQYRAISYTNDCSPYCESREQRRE